MLVDVESLLMSANNYPIRHIDVPLCHLLLPYRRFGPPYCMYPYPTLMEINNHSVIRCVYCTLAVYPPL